MSAFQGSVSWGRNLNGCFYPFNTCLMPVRTHLFQIKLKPCSRYTYSYDVWKIYSTYNKCDITAKENSLDLKMCIFFIISQTIKANYFHLSYKESASKLWFKYGRFFRNILKNASLTLRYFFPTAYNMHVNLLCI